MEELTSTNRTQVILAAGRSAARLAAQLAALIFTDHAPAATIHLPHSPGDALRFLHRHGASVLFVCVTDDELRFSSALISAVRDRLPALPILVVAAEYDQLLERSVRQAGAAFHFTIGADAREILSTLETLGGSRRMDYDDPVPARARGRPSAPLSSR